MSLNASKEEDYISEIKVIIFILVTKKKALKTFQSLHPKMVRGSSVIIFK